jgi:hypothetical protein
MRRGCCAGLFVRAIAGSIAPAQPRIAAYPRKILAIAFPLASSSISLSR